MIDLYHTKKRLKSIEVSIGSNDGVLEVNKKLIFQFRDDCLAHGIGLARMIRYLYCLRDLAIWLNKDFSECKINDIKALVAKIERMDKYAPRTKCEYKATLKKFYKFLRNTDAPEETSWINGNLKRHEGKLPSDLLTEQDIKEIINNTVSSRDRAIIMTLYESGCRIGEFLKMQIKDVSFDKYGCLLDVTGKTGGRRIRVISSASYLMDWINKHSDKNNPEAFLWVRCDSVDMLEYPALCKVLRVARNRAGLKKKVNPHNFRHSRATYLASKLTEQQLKVFFGWAKASDMAAVYVHLSGRDVNDSLLSIYGIKTEEKVNGVSELVPVKCFKCNFENEPTNKFCKMCGIPLDREESEKIIKQDTDRQQADGIMDIIIKDPEVCEVLERKIEELQKQRVIS